jgi:hypothetical protein
MREKQTVNLPKISRQAEAGPDKNGLHINASSIEGTEIRPPRFGQLTMCGL